MPNRPAILDQLLAVKLEVRRAQRSLDAVGLRDEAIVLDAVALRVQQEIQAEELAAKATTVP